MIAPTSASTTTTTTTVPASRTRVRDADHGVLRQAGLLSLQPTYGVERFSAPAFELVLLMRKAHQEAVFVYELSNELLDQAGDRALREVVEHELRTALAYLAELQPLVDLQRIALLAVQRAIMERRLIGGRFWLRESLEGDVFGVMAEATGNAKEAIRYALDDRGQLRARFGDRMLLGDPSQLAIQLARHTREAAGFYASNYGVCLVEALIFPVESLASERYEGRYSPMTSDARLWTADCRRRDIVHDVVKTLLGELDELREQAGMRAIIYTDNGIPTRLNG